MNLNSVKKSYLLSLILYTRFLSYAKEILNFDLLLLIFAQIWIYNTTIGFTKPTYYCIRLPSRRYLRHPNPCKSNKQVIGRLYLMEQLLNVILIVVGVLVGIVGIVFLSRGTRRLRTVGVLIFPFM